MDFPLISFLLLLIVIFILVTGYLLLCKGVNGNFEKVLGFGLIYLLADCLLIISVEQFYPDENWRALLAPFIFGYGPFLYFGIESLKQNRITVWNVLLHAIPFILSLLVYLDVLLNEVKLDPVFITTQINRIDILSMISFTGYGLWSFFIVKRKITDHSRTILIAFLRILFIFVTMIFVMVYFSTEMEGNEQAAYWSSALVYGCMLIVVLMIFNYVIKEIFKSTLITKSALIQHENVIALSAPKYERSALQSSDLQILAERLNTAMKTERYYLEPNLTLSSLAQYLKMPNHHLTQVFSVQFKQSFYQYVNTFRVQEACRLMDDPIYHHLTLEEIAEKSGFNAKVSFNRQFKTLMGCTPSEYRDH